MNDTVHIKNDKNFSYAYSANYTLV